MIPAGIEPDTFRFLAQHLTTVLPLSPTSNVSLFKLPSLCSNINKFFNELTSPLTSLLPQSSVTSVRDLFIYNFMTLSANVITVIAFSKIINLYGYY